MVEFHSDDSHHTHESTAAAHPAGSPKIRRPTCQVTTAAAAQSTTGVRFNTSGDWPKRAKAGATT